MQKYSKQELANLNSSQKTNTLPAETTYITVGEGLEIVGYKLADILASLTKTKKKVVKKEKPATKKKK